MVYGGILGLLAIGFAVALAMRTPLGLAVIRDRNSLFRLLDDGRIENVYTLKILNKSELNRTFDVTVTGAGALALDPPQPAYSVAPGEVYPAVVRVVRDAYQPAGSETIHFHIVARDDPRDTATHDARLHAPSR